MTAPYMRPADGTRRAEGTPQCRERYALNQATPAGMTPSSKLCLRCGRVTARRDADGWPWCGGELPTIGATA